MARVGARATYLLRLAGKFKRPRVAVARTDFTRANLVRSGSYAQTFPEMVKLMNNFLISKFLIETKVLEISLNLTRFFLLIFNLDFLYFLALL